MVDMSIASLISIIIGSGGLIGVLTTIIVIKYRKIKEKGIAIQEVKKADDIELKNTKTLIDLYKNGMTDLQKMMQTRESELLRKISDYDARISNYESENKQLKELVDTLRKNQVMIQTKLDAITVQSLQDCDKCSFKSDCTKYRAKLYINEENYLDNENETNAKNLHCN